MNNQPLSEIERQYVLLTQQGLPICAKPYQHLAEQLNISTAQTLAMTQDLLARGIIRRIAAVPNHYNIGYCFNGMTTWDVQDDYSIEYGTLVGNLTFVSHCYLRPRHLPQWHYNLFAMIHAKTEAQLLNYQQQIKRLLTPILQHHQGQSYNMLNSTRVLKKTGLRLKPHATSGN